jgi:hypothetical protein
MSSETPPPSLSPASRKVLAALTFLLLLAVYLEGLPSKVANLVHLPGLLAVGLCLGTRSSVGPGLALLVLITGGTLVTGDLGLRVTKGDMLYYRASERFIRRMPEYPFLHRYVRNVDAQVPTFGDLEAMRPPGAGPRLKRTLRFQTDSLGFRNAPGGDELPYDILTLGDSFVLGAAVAQKDTWASQLTSRHHLRSYNLAFPANPWQELILLKTTLPKIKLKPGGLILWSVFTGNDFRGGSGSVDLPPPAGLLKRIKTHLANYRNRSPVRLLLRRIFPRRPKKATTPSGKPPAPKVVSSKTPAGKEVLFYQDYLEAARFTPEDLARYPAVKDFDAVIAAMKATAEKAGFRLKVVLLPTKAEIYPHLLPPGQKPPPYPTAFSKLFQELCKKHGVPTLDLTPGFQRAAQELSPKGDESLWWPDDTHWNRRGAAVAANLIAGWEGLGLVPIGDMSAM